MSMISSGRAFVYAVGGMNRIYLYTLAFRKQKPLVFSYVHGTAPLKPNRASN